MVFSSNPLSLSVPDPAFESWLRETGYLEVLDHRTTQLHRQSTTATSSTASSATKHLPSSSCTTTTTATNTRAIRATTVTGLAYGLVMSLVSSLVTLLSLFTINPFSKLAADDFSGQTPHWSTGFLGSADSYSFPSSPVQGRMRVHENVKRYARNYATLFVLFFACTLYQMPLALLGLLSCLALWDFFRFCNDRWLRDQFPVMQQVLSRIAQCVGAIILLFSNVQMALFFTVAVSYAAMILHASFRKLTPSKQPPKGRWR
ncbi:hypothetical protein Dimus_018944 [Dionaea muscipula]